MSSNNKKKKSVLLVSNCTWYLYNFRKELISKLSDQGYYLILVSPFDNYYFRLKKYFDSKENLFLNRGSENPFLEIITLLNLLFIYMKYKPDLVHHFTIKPCLYGGTIARFLGIKNTYTKKIYSYSLRYLFRKTLDLDKLPYVTFSIFSPTHHTP